MDFTTIKFWIEKNKILASCMIVIILLFSIIIFQRQSTHEDANQVMSIGQIGKMNPKQSIDATMNSNEERATGIPIEKISRNKPQHKEITDVKVDIKGAVKFSGVYPAKSNQVVNDIVNLAVPLKNADLDAVNLATTVQDAMVIYVPFKGEVKEDKFAMYKQQLNTNKENDNRNNQKIININTAESSELEEIPGIGPKKAQEIILYRTSNGGFKSIEEIKEIKGIGDKTFESLKDFIAI